MRVVFKEDEQTWVPHSIANGVKIKTLISKREHNENVTCNLVKISKGLEVPIHSHEYQSDILYTLSGRFKMWVEGVGDFEVKKGIIIRIPKGIKHKIYNVQENTLIFNVFSPAIL
jgi:quercetin dioxygenase-like cupin family protein